MRYEKVMILSASAGVGHIRAGQAIEKALLASGQAGQVEHIDALRFANPVFRTVYSKGYLLAAHRYPNFFGSLYNRSDKPWRREKQRLIMTWLNTRRFFRMLKRSQPDLIICTHFLPVEVVSWLKGRGRLHAKHAVVITDIDPHAWWLCHHYDRYFVAMEESRIYLEAQGIDPERIVVSGIPIDPVFAETKHKMEMREKLELVPDKTIILFSTGGHGRGPVALWLNDLKNLSQPCQVVVICGHNHKLARQINDPDHPLQKLPHVSVKAIGFTNQMDEYMAAADILIGKSGGLTLSEALARELAMVIVNPIPGQEQRNSNHLLEEGAAICCNSAETLAYKINRLLDESDRLTTMQANARRLAHPRASIEVVEHLMELP